MPARRTGWYPPRVGSRTRTARHDLGYAGLRGLLGAARVMPLSALRLTGRSLARGAWRLAGRDRTRALEHLALAFPEREPAWRLQVARGARRHFGELLGEVAWLWSASPRAILARTSIEGLRNLTAPLAEGRGAVLVTGHCGNWEWLNLALGVLGVPMTVAAREVYDPRLDEVARRLRARFGGETVLRGGSAGRRLATALARKRILGLLIDQDIDVPGCFVEFFGRPAWTPSGAAVLALRGKVPVVPGFAARQKDGSMRILFEPPVEMERCGRLDRDAGLLTARATARIEAQIRRHPEQWVWMHRRWRRRAAPGDTVWSPSGPRPASTDEDGPQV